MSKLAISLILLCCVGITALGAQHVTIEKLTIDDGLSQGMVYDILQTRDGFLWIGTKDGLNRYDGYNFRVWNNNPADPYSLADNSITALFEDSRGWLWVGSESKGLHLFDRETERFYHFSFPIAIKKNATGLYDIRQITEDGAGHIWVINRGGGVFKLIIPKEWKNSLPDKSELGTLTTLMPIRLPLSGTSSEEFYSLCLANARQLFVGSSQNLYEINPVTSDVKRLTLPSGMVSEVSGLTMAADGALWGVNIAGAFRYHKGRFATYLFSTIRVGQVNAKIQTDRDGVAWVLFEDKLWRLSSDKSSLAGGPDYLLDRVCNSLAADNQGNIWVGTVGYGLRKIAPRKAMFNSSLEGMSIWGMWQSRQGEIFVKIFNKIFTYDRHTKALSSESAFPDALPQQNDLAFEPSGNFWLLSGLREGAINKTELRHYRADRTLKRVYPIRLDRYPHANLLYASDGSVWASGASGHLLRLVPESGKITNYDIGHLFGKDAASVLVFALIEDGNGHLWAGTQLGLVKGILHGEKMSFEVFKTSPHQRQSLTNNSVACLLPDPILPRKILWVGTKGGGINRLDMATGQFTYITTEEGLPNNVVYGILPDEEGNLWCSTNRGLAKIVLKGGQLEQIIPFTDGDGLQSNEFNTQAFFKAPGGELFFGGVNGMNYFLPARLKLNTAAPNIFIVGLEINNKPVWYRGAANGVKTSLEYLRRLELSHNENNISFEFSALDYTDPGKNQYKYQLLPIEKEWVFDRENHYAHYTHLSPGHYIFRVLGSNSSGSWSETPVEIAIVISPPWWFSNLAYLCYILVALTLAWYIYRSHISNIRLTARVAFEQREIERVRELEQMKSNFFSNITHEFRTPITLILEPLRQILSDPSQAHWLSKVRLAEKNSRKLLTLVNELLDLAKLESGAMKAEYRPAHAGEIIRAVVESFAVAAESKGIALRFTATGNHIMGEFDQDKLEKITANLISNAIKYTPAGGIVALYCEARHEEPGAGQLLLTVTDTGIGISPEDLPNIFERFYQSSDVNKQELQAGTGIGLALCREFAELMGGTIAVESRLGEGSIFRLQLPFRCVAVGDYTKNTAQIVFETAATFKSKANELTKLPVANPVKNAEQPLVLLAEDNEELRLFLQETLSAKYEVLVAPNGAVALEIAREKVPDIVVSDLVMPLLDGIGLLDALKKDVITSHIPIVLLTAKTALESRLQGLQHGADAYLNKPFNTEELFAWLGNLLENRRRLQEKFSLSDAVEKARLPVAVDEVLGAIDQQFIDRLYEVVEEDLDNDQLGAEELARQMNMSRSQLHRKITAMTGQSTGEFLRNYRLDKAMKLLKAGEGNVSEVSWRVGFVNSKHFSTVFKDRFGISPSEVKSHLSN